MEPTEEKESARGALRTLSAMVARPSLDEDGLELIRTTFALYQTGNGYMDVRNITNAMTVMGKQLSREELRKILDRIGPRRQIRLEDLVNVVKQKLVLSSSSSFGRDCLRPETLTNNHRSSSLYLSILTTQSFDATLRAIAQIFETIASDWQSGITSTDLRAIFLEMEYVRHNQQAPTQTKNHFSSQ